MEAKESGTAAAWLLLLLVAKSSSLGTDSDSSAMGTNFFVAAPPTQSTSIITLQHTIYVGTTYLSSNYTIKNSFGSQVSSGTAMNSAPSMYNINDFFAASEALVSTSAFPNRNKGLHIMATGSEFLFVLYTLGDNGFYSSYLAYPCVDFTEDIYEYYVISVQAPGDFNSQVLLVGCENDTNVTITPTASVDLPLDAQTEDSSLVTVASGNTSHTLTLHQTQTLLFKNTLDLTGSKILSNKPLTVISGHECGTVPMEFNFCEQLAVQIPPTLTWGTEFLLAPFAIRDTGQIYRIIAAENATALSIKECGADNVSQVAIPQAGGAFTLATTTGSYYYLTSNKPIFVTQLATGGNVDTGGDGKGDPVMLIVSPTHMYVNSTTFITLDSRFTQHAITVTILAEDNFNSSHLLFDGEPLICTWKPIENTTGSTVGWGCIFTNLTDSSQHCITHNNGGALSVLSYGFGAAIGYGYLAGMRLQRLNPTTVVDCLNLTAPTNGQVSLTTTTFGSMATYSCDDGYLLMGPPMRECQANGSWSEQEPVCQIVDCMGLLPPGNGSVDISNTTYLSVAVYECNEGFVLQGQDFRVCTNSGMWSGEEPVCQAVVGEGVTVVIQFQASLTGENKRNTEEDNFEDRLNELETAILQLIPESDPGIPTVECSTLDGQTSISGIVTIECVLTVFEEFGINGTIDTVQLTMTLQEQVPSLEVPFLNIDADSIIVGVGDICPEDLTVSRLYGNYTWPSTGGGSESNLDCVYNSTGDLERDGFARRVCNVSGVWEDPDFSDCQNTIPRVTIDRGDSMTVEIGGPVTITCTGNSVFNDVTVSWNQIVDGEENPVPSLQDSLDLTVDELRLLYSTQSSPNTAVLSSTPHILTSTAIQSLYTCRGRNQFGEDSSSISILVTRGEGEASSVYVRFSTSLANETPADQGITLAMFEYYIYIGVTLALRDGVQTINCSEKNSDPSNELARVECVVREYPPQELSSQLGDEIANFIIQSEQFSAESVVHSVEGFCDYEDDGDYEWTETVAKTRQSQQCQTPQGNATRNCLSGGLWTPVDSMECVTPPTISTPVKFSFYLRFSAELGTTLSIEFVTDTIEIEVRNAQIGVSPINCSSVPSDLANADSVRIECEIGGNTSPGNVESVMEHIIAIVKENDFYIPGTDVLSELGFCEAEITRDDDRGQYSWEETEVGSSFQTQCAFGPSNQQATRVCESRNSWGDPQILMCGTQISLLFTEFDESMVNITIDNVEMVFNNLTDIVVMATDPADQNMDNIEIISTVIFQTASLLDLSSAEDNIEPAVIELVVNDTLSIVDSVVDWPPEVVQEESNVIVQAFETIVDTLIDQENLTTLLVIEDDVALIAEQTPREEFEGLTVSAIGGDDKDLIATPGVDVQNIPQEEQTAQVTLPQEILNVIPEGEDVSVAVAVFDEPTLFPVREAPTNEPPADGAVMTMTVVGSPVVSIQVAGVEDGTQLDVPIELVLSLNQVENMTETDVLNPVCVFWDFDLLDGQGNWSTDGCTLISFDNSTGAIQCECTHLTNFACLVDISARGKQPVTFTPVFENTLHYVSIIGCSLSLVGLFLTVLTLLIFKKLRKRDASKFHIQLCLSLGAMFIVFVVGIDRTENRAGCITIGVLIHYFALVAWMWMGAEALLMFQKLIIVFGQITYRYILLVSLVCWAAPVVPVVISVGINPDHYITEDRTINDTNNGTNNATTISGFCYISNVWVFFFAFLAPIFLILIFNFVMFFLVIRTIIKHQLGRSKFNATKEGFKKKDVLKTLISLVGITFLFGMTWLFAIFTFNTTNVNVSFALQFLFALFNSLQGFFIFFFFVVLTADARQEWVHLLWPFRKKAQPITSSSNRFPVKSSSSGTAATLSSAVPPYQSATLEKNVQKYYKQSQEMMSFRNPVTVKEDEEESSPDLMEPPSKGSCGETLPKIPLDQMEEVKGMEEEEGLYVHPRVKCQSTKKQNDDIESKSIELYFGLPSDESLDEEEY